MATSQVVIPGQPLGQASKYISGPGTHIHQGKLYSSLLGIVTAEAAEAPGPTKRLTRITPAPTTALSTLSVTRFPSSQAGTATNKTKRRQVLPEVGNVVLCRVFRIAPRQAVATIEVCGDTVLDAEWHGVIRVQDVRATEKDRVKMYESFRPGDVVRAEVISLGDQANYYLSTAQNELGVVMATSEDGNTMFPISWKEYKDPETGLTEPRKVAKPF